MKIMPPNLDKNLLQEEDLFPYITHFYEDDITIEGLHLKNFHIEKKPLSKICFEGCILEHCSFLECDLEKSSFVDVTFKNCDFSNSDMNNGYFSRCEFLVCKCIGTDMTYGNLKHVLFQESNLEYINLNNADFNYVYMKETDMSNSLVSESRLKKFEAKNTLFINTNFFRTPLKGIDFRENELMGITVSDQFKELAGMIINEYQASDIVKLLGIVIKERES